MRVVRIKNNSGADDTWNGHFIADGEYYEIKTELEAEEWADEQEVFDAISTGDLVVNDGTNDIVDTLEGWKWLTGDVAKPVDLPGFRSSLGNKLSVHGSAKPIKQGKTFYLVWSGCGDDMVNGVISDGPRLQFLMTPSIPEKTISIEFDPQYGETYIHEGYLMFNGAGEGDEISATVVANGTQLQTSVNLDLVVDADGWVSMSPSGPGTGTHGFAANPTLISRSFSGDGNWDYDPVNGLVPNMDGTGNYSININDHVVHKYINNIPLYGNSYGYVILTSDESAYLPPNYRIDVTVKNASGGTWSAHVFFEVFREATAIP